MAYHPVKEHDSSLTSDDDLPAFNSDEHVYNRSTWSSSLTSQRLSTITLVLVFVESIIIIILAGTNLSTLRATLRHQEILEAQHSIDIRETLPTTFSRDHRYMTLEEKYDHLWDVWTESPQLVVPGDLPGEGDIPGSYSMFHQMHCLASFRRAIQQARAGKDPGYDFFDDGHWPHCFDYLRKSILCWADNTIEIPAAIDGKRLPFIDGTRMMRQCRKTDLMYRNIRSAAKKAEAENGEAMHEEANETKPGHSS